VEVVSFNAGTSGVDGYDNAAVALGSPERFTGDGGSFPGVVSPFNPPFMTNEIVSIGEGGHLTLRLSNYIVPQAAGPELGVFANVGLADSDFPNGFFDAPYTVFGVDSALVDVSEFGTTWIELGEFVFDIPANGYADAATAFDDTPGSVETDFGKPFEGGLADFQDRRLADNGGSSILDLLDGSGGGNWLDISAAGLDRVGFIRFRIADDGDMGTGLNFELDAVSIATAALGGQTVPEPAAWLLLTAAMSTLATRRAVATRRSAT
jgi:hypothetical protein